MTIGLFVLRPFLSPARRLSVTRQRSEAQRAEHPWAHEMETKCIKSVGFPLPTLLFPILLLLSLISCSGSNSPAAPSSPALTAATVEQETFAKINEYRVSKGLAALTWSDTIANQARQHSQDMFSGVTPVGHDGLDNRLAIIGQTIPWSRATENVAQDHTVTLAVTGWLNSPPHLSNIEGDFNLTGIGVGGAWNFSWYFT